MKGSFKKPRGAEEGKKEQPAVRGSSTPSWSVGNWGGRERSGCMWSFWTVSHVDFYVAAWSVLANSSEGKERARREGGGCLLGKSLFLLEI